MKLFLIEPPKAPLTIGGEDVFIYEPLALEYIAAGVAKNHDVKIFDLRIEKDLQGILKDFSPDVVGITAYTVHVNTVKKLFKKIKEWSPKVLTVVGGHHATMVPEDFLSPFIDLIVMGEGVFAFSEIITRFERGGGFDGIPGVAFAGLLSAPRSRRVGPTAILKGTLAARRGRKVTALDHYRTRGLGCRKGVFGQCCTSDIERSFPRRASDRARLGNSSERRVTPACQHEIAKRALQEETCATSNY